MTGTIAQIVALVAYGNDYLANNNLPIDFYTSNSAFHFCNLVDFRVFRKKFFSSKFIETVIAESPEKWFIRLKEDNCKKLRLLFQYSKQQLEDIKYKDFQMAGFVGGGGTWLIEAVYSNYSDFWANRWMVTRKDDPNQKIWTVNYGMTAVKQKTTNLQFDLDEAKNSLHKALIEISFFAEKHNEDFWVTQFNEALTILSSDKPASKFYADIIPLKNYSMTAQQLLFSAGTAWVFGGMGSWNDIGLNDSEYIHLSEQLYDKIITAIIAASNSY